MACAANPPVPRPRPRRRKRARSRCPGARHGDAADPPAKRAKRTRDEPRAAPVRHALLARYYSETQTLRQYVLSRLPPSSRLRRKKIASVGLARPAPAAAPSTEAELALGDLLDTTLVARRHPAGDSEDHRWEQWLGFAQKGDESYVTLSDGLGGCVVSQSEIVDFVVWLLFSRESAGSWPRHLLCDGFRRQAGAGSGPAAATAIPGLCAVYPNQHVQTLKRPPWPQLLLLLGREGERIMIDLLVDCALFRAVKAGRGNLHQLGGIPISELEPLPDPGVRGRAAPASASTSRPELRPSEISFVRNRMLYARPALNARGLVHFGLRHIHVLNRFPHKSLPPGQPDHGVVHIMMYMFPRQFGLHNVFSSTVDRQQTAQTLQDYTLREDEIAAKFPAPEDAPPPARHVPKRLRGKAMHLVKRLQVRHGRCSYAAMLHHYCPVPGMAHGRTAQPPPSSKPTKGKKPRPASPPAFDLQYSALTELATPASSVSAFCQAVVSKVVPDEFWGRGATQDHNKACFLKKVHHFVHLRRFESLCLHEVMQGMKIGDLEWLAPPALAGRKSSQSDARKRAEILYEFLYYLFDSFLIPLIRSNFYVTESSVDRYRLFFFRHDVWRYVAEPAMAALKTSMFEEVKTEDALRILQSRRLGYSQVRLLPKQDRMRPIMNLRRRTLLQHNKKVLGPSINSVLAPVNSVLRLERARDPGRLGASLFSVGDIYQRIKAFKRSLGEGPHRFYFVKVDVQAAFDTIPQDAIIALLRQIPQQSRYRLSKHAEVALVESASGGASGARPSRRWHATAQADGDSRSFAEHLEATLAAHRKNTAFVRSAVQRPLAAADLLALTASHIAQNLVRFGKKYYRQRAGIPQGSVLSSALCSYFYADLERTRLGFLRAGDDTLLLRLIDDFLLVTTDRAKAGRFAEVMLRGVPEYGVTVAPGKSLASFPLVVAGSPVPMREGGGFPYCGLLIDTATLAVTKQRDKPGGSVFNSLTVEYARCPGWNFKRKVINAFKIQSHLLFFDTAHNSRRTVLANIYAAFAETATKMWAYARCMRVGGGTRRPGPGVLIDTTKTLIDVAFVLLTSRARTARYPGYVCSVKKSEVAWLAMVAFRQVLAAKQTGYAAVLAWLEAETQAVSARKGLDVGVLVGVAREGWAGGGVR